jgi:hypothetical protein
MLRLARAVLKCASAIVVTRDERVGGPPIGAVDEEGFNVCHQALGNLCAGRKVTVTACQLPSLLPLAFKHGGSAAPAMDALTTGNSFWVRTTPLSAEDNEYVPNCLKIASLSQERSLRYRLLSAGAIRGYEMKCLNHTMPRNSNDLLFHSMKWL